MYFNFCICLCCSGVVRIRWLVRRTSKHQHQQIAPAAPALPRRACTRATVAVFWCFSCICLCVYVYFYFVFVDLCSMFPADRASCCCGGELCRSCCSCSCCGSVVAASTRKPVFLRELRPSCLLPLCPAMLLVSLTLTHNIYLPPRNTSTDMKLIPPCTT